MMSCIKWVLPRDLLALSLKTMAPHGKLGNEGLALWLGRVTTTGAEITHLVELRGPGFRTSPLNLSISLLGMSTLTDLAEAQGAYLVGQIHSHPENYTDLSAVDRVHGIRVPNFLSLVCPFYAQQPKLDLDQCGVHVFEDGGFRRMAATEVESRLSVAHTTVKHLVLEVPA